MQGLSTLNDFAEAEKYFSISKYKDQIPPISEAVEQGDYLRAKKLLEALPSKKALLDSLTEKLKGKAVYKTLRRISEGRFSAEPEMLKGLSSLLTHVAIEVERGNTEYRILYPVIYEKIGQVLYRS